MGGLYGAPVLGMTAGTAGNCNCLRLRGTDIVLCRTTDVDGVIAGVSTRVFFRAGVESVELGGDFWRGEKILERVVFLFKIKMTYPL